jgi:hypothetical protein
MLLSSANPEDLSPGTVHVWQIDLSQGGDRVQHCRELLSEDENQRAARFFLTRIEVASLSPVRL